MRENSSKSDRLNHLAVMDGTVESQSESETRCVPEKTCKSDSVSTTNTVTAYKPSKKLIRVLTVIGYVISVSLAGVMLSLYYVFLWRPTVNNVRPDARTALLRSEPALPQALVGFEDSSPGIPSGPPTISVDDPSVEFETGVKSTPVVATPNRQDAEPSPTHPTSLPNLEDARGVSTDEVNERRQLASRFRSRRGA